MFLITQTEIILYAIIAILVIALSIVIGVWIAKRRQPKITEPPINYEDFFSRIKKNGPDYTKRALLDKDKDYNSVLIFYENKLIDTIIGDEDFIASKYTCDQLDNHPKCDKLVFYSHRNHLKNFEFALNEAIYRMVFDPEYKIPLDIYTKGRIKLEIVEYNKFFYHIVKFRDRYEFETFKDLKFTEINTYLVNVLAECLSNRNHSVIEANYYLKEIEEAVRIKVNQFLESMGLLIKEFLLFEIEVKESDNQKEINNMLLSYQKFNLPEYSYQIEKKIDFYNKKVESFDEEIELETIEE